jgi:hypothetical protein
MPNIFSALLLSFLQVDLRQLPTLATWKRDYTMETILLELRRYDFSLRRAFDPY